MRQKFFWLTESQAQTFLDCKRGTLWKLRTEGKVHYTKEGRRTFYYRPSIENLLIQNSTLSEEQIASLQIQDHE